MSHVLDASAILALAFDEPGAENVVSALPEAAISAVNYSEAAAKLVEKGFIASEARDFLLALRLEVKAFDENQAWETAMLRRNTRSRGLSFADRACLSLALAMDAVALTADRAWTELDIGCRVELVR